MLCYSASHSLFQFVRQFFFFIHIVQYSKCIRSFLATTVASLSSPPLFHSSSLPSILFYSTRQHLPTLDPFILYRTVKQHSIQCEHGRRSLLVEQNQLNCNEERTEHLNLLTFTFCGIAENRGKYIIHKCQHQFDKSFGNTNRKVQPPEAGSNYSFPIRFWINTGSVVSHSN